MYIFIICFCVLYYAVFGGVHIAVVKATLNSDSVFFLPIIPFMIDEGEGFLIS